MVSILLPILLAIWYFSAFFMTVFLCITATFNNTCSKCSYDTKEACKNANDVKTAINERKTFVIRTAILIAVVIFIF